jgi:hypothetical protein
MVPAGAPSFAGENTRTEHRIRDQEAKYLMIGAVGRYFPFDSLLRSPNHGALWTIQ